MGPRRPEHGKDSGRTTVVLTGLPKTVNAETMLSLLDENFHGCYDYFYLPMDVDRFESPGLAYINFRSHERAVECQRFFTGFSNWPGSHYSARMCKAQWSSIQGYEANIRKQQQTDWDRNVPEDCKPMVFDEQGTRLPTMDVFPPKGWNSNTQHAKGWAKEWYGSSSNTQKSDGQKHDQEWDWDWRREWQSGWHEEWSDTSDTWGQWRSPFQHVSESKHVESEAQESNGSNESNVQESKVELYGESKEPGVNVEIDGAKVQLPTGASGVSSIFTGASRLARYACPSCKTCFAKWSACQHHLLSEVKCRVETANLDSLQEICKEQAEISSHAQGAFQDDAISKEVRRFQ